MSRSGTSRLSASRVGRAVLALTFLLSPNAAQAANITITGNDPRHNITVTIEDATVDFVLDNLHKKFGFEVAGLPANVAGGEAQTITLSGSLQVILERLLRNWNHMIVRSPDNESGIAKVMILNATYGAGPARPGQVGANGEGTDKLLQALTGEGVD
jgi:hypothetical protein